MKSIYELVIIEGVNPDDLLGLWAHYRDTDYGEITKVKIPYRDRCGHYCDQKACRLEKVVYFITSGYDKRFAACSPKAREVMVDFAACEYEYEELT